MHEKRQAAQSGKKAERKNVQDAIRAKYGLNGPSQAGESEEKTMCGWLLKRGKVNKAFKQRWFRLVGSNLEYYADIEGSCTGVIDISNRASINLIKTSKGISELHIGLADGRRTFVLREDADSRSASLDTWRVELIHAQENTRFD
jgi:hypothetical protein